MAAAAGYTSQLMKSACDSVQDRLHLSLPGLAYLTGQTHFSQSHQSKAGQDDAMLCGYATYRSAQVVKSWDTCYVAYTRKC